MRILIDAGHGIDTPGKRSPDSAFREYLWNREVADMVMERLGYLRKSWGIESSLVVTETNDVPLKTRASRVNAVCNAEGKSNVLLVSIHSNASGTSGWNSAQGWSCYTSPGKTKADDFAECFYDAFTEAFPERRIRTDMKDGDRDFEENFYILTKTQCPACLLENFFYDNKEECAWLLKEETKERIADAIIEGIRNYLSMA